MIFSRCSRLRFCAELPFHLARAHVQRERGDFLERAAIHRVFGGHGRVAVGLVVRHEPPLLCREHFGVFGHFRLALEDHRAVIGRGEHRVGRVDPVRGDGAVHFVHFERALPVGEQVFELLIGAMQVDLDGLAEEQEWIEPDVRLAFGTHGDEVAELLFAERIRAACLRGRRRSSHRRSCAHFSGRAPRETEPPGQKRQAT